MEDVRVVRGRWVDAGIAAVAEMAIAARGAAFAQHDGGGGGGEGMVRMRGRRDVRGGEGGGG